MRQQTTRKKKTFYLGILTLVMHLFMCSEFHDHLVISGGFDRICFKQYVLVFSFILHMIVTKFIRISQEAIAENVTLAYILC